MDDVKKPYSEMTHEELRDEYARILFDGLEYATPKKLRKLHKYLKKYDDGVRFKHRYPDLYDKAMAVVGLMGAVMMGILMILLAIAGTEALIRAIVL